MKSFKIVSALMAVAVCCLAGTARGGIVFTSLVQFTGTNGAYPGAGPFCGLTEGPDGNFYGTTAGGGSNNMGTIFRITPAGSFHSIFSFNGTNGATPYAALMVGQSNYLYGSAFTGGVSNWGTIFLITTNGNFTNLYTFGQTGTSSMGADPGSALIPMGDGSFYGTADYGGLTNAAFQGKGYGSVFHLSGGSLTALAVLGNTNGAHPSGGMILGQDGNFYGTTTWGGQGISSTFPGYGTIFKMTPEGVYTNIYQFTGFDDGGYIYSGLVQGPDGYLYGGAFSGGSLGAGTLFKISTNGTYTGPLHTFTVPESGAPYAGMIVASDGNLYGTTYGVASGTYGSVFGVTPDGVFTNLFLFSNTNGAQPAGVLLQGPDNNFYGTTAAGGPSGLGTIFRLSVPLAPLITGLDTSNNMLSLTWSSVAEQSYVVQSLDDLTQTNWTSLTTPLLANTGTLTATNVDTLASPGQRFYRVVVQ